MPDIYFESIEPTARNAEAMVRLSHQDLLRAGSPISVIREVADPNNRDHIERQLERIESHRDRYLGAFAVGDLVAMEKVNEWLTGDQYPFARPLTLERLGLLRSRMAGEIHLPGRPLGIFSLVVHHEMEPKQATGITHSLARWAIAKSGGSEIRIALEAQDPVMPVLLDEGFNNTGKRGRLMGVEHTMFARPADVLADA